MAIINSIDALENEPLRFYIAIRRLPDELILHILWFLDIPDLYATSRASRHLRALSLDPLLHQLRLKYAHDRVQWLLSRRPPLSKLQPPTASIYLSRTHVAARRLHWSLVCIRLQRSLSRRPALEMLISNGKIPSETCKYDRRSGEFVWGMGVAGTLVERKRKVEREQIKEGLRVWLERKAKEISTRRSDGGVGTLIWRFSRLRRSEAKGESRDEMPKKERVTGLKSFFEDLGA